ncbi:MAG: leucine-rich repeat domain-containing protein, partial [Prevotella sp.]|nr:leucine-rich repeat domain-containing protein [Prevotella sp.]
MKRKKLLFLLLALVLSATGAYAQTVGTNFKVGDIEYTITKKDLNNPQNNEVAVYYIGGSGAVTVPPTVQNDQDKETYKVTSSTEWTDCSKDIESLTFSEGYTTMGNGCYRSATNLKKVTLPASFTTMSHSCFENCPKFTEYEVAGSSSTFKNNDKGWLLSKDGTTLVSCPSGTQGDIVIPEGITTLAKTA